MAIKELLVHVDVSKSNEVRADYAFGLAEVHQAHVIGVAYAPPRNGKLRETARSALDDFVAARARRGLSVETRLIECSAGDFPNEMVLHARHADLTLIGQPGEEAGGPQRALLEELLFQSGRPALVVPWAGKPNPQPETVMIAWDASGTAARAVAESLPMLKRAKKVVILIAMGDQLGLHGKEPGSNIALHLARHDIAAEARRIPLGSDVSAADLLLSQAADLGAELMVMGAYHHSRLRESVLGGVTRTILESMTLPVLMSH